MTSGFSAFKCASLAFLFVSNFAGAQTEVKIGSITPKDSAIGQSMTRISEQLKGAGFRSSVGYG
jgi:hypothetical protein